MKWPNELVLTAVILLVAAAVSEITAYKCDVSDEEIRTARNETSRSFWGGHRTKWPNGIHKYELHVNLTARDRVEVKKAMDDISSKTCVRFQQKAADDPDKFVTLIEADNRFCGYGSICRVQRERYNFVVIGGQCREMNTIVHELGHNLCMGHEMSRQDRDTFLDFRNCDANSKPGVYDDQESRGSLYDYTSQMAYGCGWCPGGWPKPPQVTKCGDQVQKELSVMDADKLNEFYDCTGCFSHRWKLIGNLTQQDKNNMVAYGRKESGEPYYACRGLINGKVCIGKYDASWGACMLPYEGREYAAFDNAQVFTIPSESSAKRSYKVVKASDYVNGRVSGKAVPSGRTVEAVTSYIAIGDIRGETAIGEVFEKDMSTASFPYGREEVKSRDFSIVVCG